VRLKAEKISDRDLFVVGETPFTHNADDIVPYVLPSNKELQMVFHFEIMDIDSASRAREQSPFVTQRFALSELKKVIGKWQTCRRDEGFWNRSLPPFTGSSHD
jgi:alpha-glucosidase